jgi:hypothetical protein
MARARTVRRVLKAFLPIVLVILLAVVAVSVWLVYTVTRPQRAPYLVTPQSFSKVTGAPVSRTVEAVWKNHDGTDARGWLLLGADRAPAIILLHCYGADRSLLFNLAIKLNESTNFTVLWPDLRGHGENPPVNWTLFGGPDGDDVTAAIDYLRTLKTAKGEPQVAPRIGIYGIELGSYAALDAARRYPEVRALALDSVPGSPEDVVRAASDSRAGLKNPVFHRLARIGVRIYGMGKFQMTPSCELARSLREVRVLVLAGGAADQWRQSSVSLAPCFNPPAELKTDLPLTGASLSASTGEQEETYARPVIEFFDRALR